MERITTTLEIAGVLLVVAAAAVALAAFSVPVALATAGVLLIGTSWLAARLARRAPADGSTL